MTKLTAKELESLDANDAGRVLREDGGLSGKVQLKKKGITVAFYYPMGREIHRYFVRDMARHITTGNTQNTEHRPRSFSDRSEPQRL